MAGSAGRRFKQLISQSVGFGGQGLAAWALAGVVAYVVWVRPELQENRRRSEELAGRLQAIAEADKAFQERTKDFQEGKQQDL